MAANKSNRRPGEVETTGHEWDGIEEFNNPMPRWWLWTFYACIAWALVYSIAYPAWPMLTRATQGVLGYNRIDELNKDIDRFAAMNGPIRAQLVDAELTSIPGNPELVAFANQAGAAVFKTWCAQCHGAGAAGVQASGYPNLLDDDWLWGGDIEAIHTTISHGIRNGGDEARFSQMPAFADMLSAGEISQVVQYVRQISNQEHDAALASDGATLFEENCASCHGEDGKGNRDLGAPNLTDAIWLYGGDYAALTESVKYARYGVMPGWNARLSEADIRAVAVYVHGLGGGE
ncbi:MAG: cytochrome-c oxidase, cbb3-type subunit III [Gemmobacter sp.]|jgi:cytochrome c oxidase cbb3-type subunit III|nr:cytochrome-c oxidase, cbb3-type subunit III [Gemmobacter sp.]